MSLRSSGSETEIKDFIFADYRPEMKSESGMVDDNTSEDAPNRFGKQSVFYGCDPEMIPDYNYPPRRPDYSGDVPYKPLLAQELGLGCNYKTEDFIFKGNVVIGIKCAICKGNHDFFTCKLRERCPFDQKVPEDFEVVCLCCSRTQCTKRSYPIGRVTFKESSSYLDEKSPKYMLF